MSGASWPDHQGEPDARSWPASPALPPTWQGPAQYAPGQYVPGPYVPLEGAPGYGWSPGQPGPGPATPWWGPPYNGARYGLPPSGPGSLANPWARLGARILDGLILSPVVFICLTPLFIYVAANINKFPPPDQSNNTAAFPTGFIVGLYSLFFLCFLLEITVSVVWEAVATRTWGRTPGKAILHIRPIKVTANQVRFERMSKGTCWGRAAAYFGFNLVSVLGLLDVLWCLWDQERQCLHDKVASTVVVND
jgi:uncharacterized RDD family membrane protein YckC